MRHIVVARVRVCALVNRTRSEARDAHTHSVGDAHVQRGYKLTALSGEYEAEEGVYTACDDVADQNSG